MIATLEAALFAAPVDPLLLLSILRHGQECSGARMGGQGGS
ncbi:MAG TPA: hypothetical protein VFZ09_15185 [Archangium sp.]|nr:hypothetical protein [Archangium sp.]HEX5747589.1 hypothetical protein [Archangium sp.]